MNQLFINKNAIQKGTKLIQNIDSYFNSLILTEKLKLDDNDIIFLKEIDGSTLSKDDGYIDTPFSNHVDILKISTGTKTLILANHCSENDIIDISQCGYNVIEILFNNMDNKKYYLSFCIIPDNLKISVRINNSKKLCTNKYELLDVWEDIYDS